MVSRAPENVAARRKVVPLANVGGNDAEGDHLASAFGALRDAVRSFRCHSARPTLDPGGHCRRLCRRSIVPGGWRGSCVRGPFDELAFVRRSAFDTNGERKTVIIGESDDFRPFAAFGGPDCEDRKSTRLNSSHDQISYAVFCLKKKNKVIE